MHLYPHEAPFSVYNFTIFVNFTIGIMLISGMYLGCDQIVTAFCYCLFVEWVVNHDHQPGDEVTQRLLQGESDNERGTTH